MINQNAKTDYTSNEFSTAIKELQIGRLLRRSNIRKSCGVSAYEVFQFLLLLVFQGKNLFRFLNSKHQDRAVSKNTYYRFLNDTSFNWTKFLLLLSAKVSSTFSALTRPERVKVLILDDSVIKRSRSNAVELLARVYDHVEHRYQKGLLCSPSDGPMATAFCRYVLTCSPLQRKVTVTRRSPVRSTTVLMVTKPEKKVYSQNLMQPAD